ncbi:MAG TPA: DUF5752 family protein [Candidatus Polarisedimenticolia bacterium]|nr:DUF5752 family protein [Candidatus Polarisedimenticolia bacterium]
MKAGRPAPFEVKDCALITLALGRTAQNLLELRERITAVPAESLYHHIYHTLLRPTFDDPEFRNDFALWARRELHDHHLAEQLGVIDPADFEDLESLRQGLLDVIEGRLAEIDHVPFASPGGEFQFMRSQVVVFSDGRRASTPGELAELIPRLEAGCIFFHFIEARRRPPLRVDDFSAWLEAWGPDYESLRSRLAAIDFYFWSLGELRSIIADTFSDVPGRRGR